MFQKSVIQTLNERLLEPRRHIQVLMGPRQVGKTTVVTQLAQKDQFPMVYHAADAVPTEEDQWLDQVWNAARLQLKTQGYPFLVLVIDEIQKLHQWSELVKRQWDQDTRDKINLKVVLLGSSQILMQRGLSESLAGRFELIKMGHWTFREMHDAFGLDVHQYAWFGGYPGSVPLMEDEARWKGYIRDSLAETAISRDIFQMTRVDKPTLLRNLFELGSIYSGQVLSYNKMLGQLKEAGNTTTLTHYLRLLDTAGLLSGLEKYSGKPVRQRSSSPKFQVHNTALRSIRSHLNFRDAQADPAEWGRVAESAVGSYLLNESFTKDYTLYYWREGDYEVDFILELHGRIVALEVKSGKRYHHKGISRFKERFGSHKSYIIGPEGIPIEQFLQTNLSELF
jgi:uncharacterized protein